MFIVKSDTNKTITWPVVVETAADGGKIQKYEFTGTFKLLDDDQREALAAEVKSEALGVESADEGGNAWKERAIDGIMKIMTDWKNVVDQDKKPIEFTRENLRAAARSIDGVSIIRAINIAITSISLGAITKN